MANACKEEKGKIMAVDWNKFEEQWNQASTDNIKKDKKKRAVKLYQQHKKDPSKLSDEDKRFLYSHDKNMFSQYKPAVEADDKLLSSEPQRALQRLLSGEYDGTQQAQIDSSTVFTKTKDPRMKPSTIIESERIASEKKATDAYNKKIRETDPEAITAKIVKVDAQIATATGKTLLALQKQKIELLEQLTEYSKGFKPKATY